MVHMKQLEKKRLATLTNKGKIRKINGALKKVQRANLP